MTQTLRRELRIKFMDLIREEWVDTSTHEGQTTLSNALADAALEVAGIAKQTDELKTEYIFLPQSDLAWTIAAGNKIDQKQIDQNKLMQEALNAFERDMQLPGNWQWYAVKPAEEKIWKALREFLVKKYVENKKAFAEYKTWSAQPYSRGAMGVKAIKNNPQDFEASWSDFLASNSAYGKKTNRFETLT